MTFNIGFINSFLNVKEGNLASLTSGHYLELSLSIIYQFQDIIFLLMEAWNRFSQSFVEFLPIDYLFYHGSLRR